MSRTVECFTGRHRNLVGRCVTSPRTIIPPANHLVEFHQTFSQISALSTEIFHDARQPTYYRILDHMEEISELSGRAVPVEDDLRAGLISTWLFLLWQFSMCFYGGRRSIF